jgi:capsular exopolysaccharide synthesis family protein
MDYEQPFQQLANSRNITPLPTSRPSVYADAADETNQESLDLSWLFAVFRRRFFVMFGIGLLFSLVAGAIIVRGSRQIVPQYQGSFRVLVEPITAEGRLAQLYLMAQTTTASADIQRIRIEDSTFVDYETLIRVLKSPTLLNPVVQQLKTEYPNITFNSLVSNLDLMRISVKVGTQEQGTKILVVSYKNQNPKQVEAVLAELQKAYLDYSLQERLTNLRQGIDFIGGKLPALENRVDNLQGELQRLRQEYNLMDPELAGRSMYEHAMGIERLRLNTQVDLAQARTNYANLQAQLATDNAASIMAREMKGYDFIKTEIQRLESQIAVDSTLFYDDSEPMLDLREKQENLNRIALREVQSYLLQIAGEIESLESREQKLLQAESEIDQQLRQLPEVARLYTDLQRKLDVATNSLREFLKKLEALEIDAARREIPWQIIDPPGVPRDQNGQYLSITVTQTKRQLAVAVIVSMLLGVGVGFLVEVLITVFHTPNEVKSGSKLPLLAVIPLSKELRATKRKARKTLSTLPELALASGGGSGSQILPRGVSAQGYHASPVLEAFRSLYTNIRLLSYEMPIHSLVISAATPGDGKSTVALNLAQTAAAIGQRVLLVDADLRHPKIHTKLDLPNFQGLSDAISTDISLNDVIQKSPLDENLFVLTAGTPSIDPIKLLSSKKMHSLMEQFQDFFDLVIYDTPPLVGLADGSIVAAQTDGLIMVVSIAKTDRSMVTKALEGLKISSTPVLGVVANGVKQ